jgi:hypothetical protein
VRRVFRIAGWIMLGLVTAFVLAFAWGRLRPVPTEAREALALMHEDRRPAHEHEVWPLIWLYDVDVPVDRMDEVYRDEVAELTHELAAGEGRPFKLLKSPARGKFGGLPDIEAGEMDLLCGPATADCVAHAKQNGVALAALLQRQAERLRRTRLILAGDDAWSADPLSPMMPIASGINQKRLWLNDAALDFAQGRRAEGLRKACSDAAGWRRLHRHTNTLLTSLAFASYARQTGQLFAQMLADTSPDEALPVECGEAFAPPVEADVDLCAPMQAEVASMSALLHHEEPGRSAWDKLSGWLAFSTGQYEADAAVDRSRYCRRATTRDLLVGKDLVATPSPAYPDIFEWISNGAGSILSKIALPAYEGYARRSQDYAASLRTLATMLWLRETRTDGRPLAERFATRPTAMRSEGVDDIVLAPDGRSLQFRQRNPTSSTPPLVTIPLPAGL